MAETAVARGKTEEGKRMEVRRNQQRERERERQKARKRNLDEEGRDVRKWDGEMEEDRKGEKVILAKGQQVQF